MNDTSVQINLPTHQIFAVRGEVQHYAWGGHQFIPNLLGVKNSGNQPFAEFWMGAHTKAPSYIRVEDTWVGLDKAIAQNPDTILGNTVATRFDNRLPYLFKVLDVKDMLSIQVHPTKSEAEKGFAHENKVGIPLTASNRNYRDDNHKPEIMVALTDFWLLHGFRPLGEIDDMISNIPEFEVLRTHWGTGDLYLLYKYIMELPQGEINLLLDPLAKRIVPLYEAGELTHEQPDFWAARAIVNSVLEKEDYDRGIFSIYFFNLVQVKSGEGIFQDAGIPHAYLEGVNVELMANSDNVLRGGLTPKHIDVPELLKHTVFKSVTPNILKGDLISSTERVYTSPAPDFQLSQIQIDKDQSHHQSEHHAADTLIVLKGKVKVTSAGQTLSFDQGEVFLGPAGVAYEIQAQSDAELFKATVPLT